MKLLYIVPRLGGAGGMQRVLLLKAGYLSETKNHDITILVTNPDAHHILYPVAPGITVKRIAPQSKNALFYFFAYRKAIAKVVNDVKPDVVIVCDNGLKSLFLKKIMPANVPVVYEMHASKYFIENELKKARFVRLLYKPLLAMARQRYNGYTKFVALTQAGAAEWQLDNALTIANPIWFSATKYDGVPQKKVVVMSRHVPQKGYDRMFRVWKKISAQCPDWTLEIYGNYNPDHDLTKMATALLLTNVVFHEPVTDIAKAYSQASLSIMTSYNEPFGMVLIEAMECGVPCVAFKSLGPEAIINDGVNGFLITDNDEEGFATRLQQLMQDEALRLRLSTGAKETAARFNLPVIMEQWDALFRSLIKRA